MTHAAVETRPSMTFEAFRAFTDTRPDDERWELVDGQAVMNAAPADVHQIIVGNIHAFLLVHKNTHGSDWMPLPGHGVPVRGNAVDSVPIPDVLVRPDVVTGQSYTRDPIVAFEVMSPSNDRADRAWRLRAYASVPSIRHYVIVEQKTVRVAVLNRKNDWAEHVFDDIRAEVELDAIGLTLPLAEIYRWTGFDPRLVTPRT